MHRNKQIAIILSDTLRSIGLQSLLTDYFPPVEVCYFPNFEMLSSTGSDTYDYYFTDSDTLVLNADFFLPSERRPLPRCAFAPTARHMQAIVRIIVFLIVIPPPAMPC